MKKGVQQIMLGSVTGSEAAARATLQRIRAAGYDGLEHNLSSAGSACGPRASTRTGSCSATSVTATGR